MTRRYDTAMAGAGITVVQFSILRNLARLGPLPLMQLADVLVMERTTLYRALGPLEREKWVSITDGEGRAKTATLTPQGRRTLTTATDAWVAVQQQLMDAIGIKDWTSLENSLARLVAAALKPAT